MIADPPPAPSERRPYNRICPLPAALASARLLCPPVRKKASKRWKTAGSAGSNVARVGFVASPAEAAGLNAIQPS